jgi:hypothetical protein
MLPWGEVDKALHALVPDTVNAATAIFYAVQRDEEEGYGCDWEDEIVEKARLLALPELPRPR